MGATQQRALWRSAPFNVCRMQRGFSLFSQLPPAAPGTVNNEHEPEVANWTVSDEDAERKASYKMAVKALVKMSHNDANAEKSLGIINHLYIPLSRRKTVSRIMFNVFLEMWLVPLLTLSQ